ncbi:MAG: hypothetical protein PHN76_13495 [Advenella sp.]|uniref:hypothetical protein n=1 Tax=Advenella sp. TaxID=1872388 RepID=UPI0025839BBA|nr:hypothetical protein [Advenella sp.]MDD3759155.1 hypothetical protein [Advenella sp.]
MKKRSKRVPRPIKIPITGMRNRIALDARIAFDVLCRQPDVEKFDDLIDIFNTMTVIAHNDARFEPEKTMISGASRALILARELIANHLQLPQRLLDPIRIGVNTIDEMLPRIDVALLINAERSAVAAVKKIMREERDAKKTIE